MRSSTDKALLREAFGRDSAPEVRRAALAQLLAQEHEVKPSEAVSNQALPESSQPADLPPSATPADSSRPQVRTAGVVKVAVVASCVAFLIGASIGLVTSTSGPEGHGSDAPSLANGDTPPAEDFDFGSLRYVGSFESAAFWAATRDGGKTACLIAEDAGQVVLPSSTSCAPVNQLGSDGIGFGSAEIGIDGTLSSVYFSLNLSPDGSPTFAVTDS